MQLTNTNPEPEDEDEGAGGQVPDAVADRKTRARKRAGAAGNSGDGAAAADVPPLTEAAATGQPEKLAVTPSLSLRLRAPVVRESAALYERLLTAFPDLLVWGALGDRKGRGLSIPAAVRAARAIAEERLASLERMGDAAEPEAAAAMRQACERMGAYTEELAEDALRDLSLHLAGYEPAPEGEEPHVLDGICDAVWDLAGPAGNPGLTREALPGLLLDSLRAAEFCDLLRACLRCASGSDQEYKNDVQQRFGQP